MIKYIAQIIQGGKTLGISELKGFMRVVEFGHVRAGTMEVQCVMVLASLQGWEMTGAFAESLAV